MKNSIIRLSTILLFCAVFSNADLIQITASGTVNNLTPNVALRGTPVSYIFQYDVDLSGSRTASGQLFTAVDKTVDGITTDYFFADLIGGTLNPSISIPKGFTELNLGSSNSRGQNTLYGGSNFNDNYVSLGSTFSTNISKWNVGTRLDGYERSVWAFSTLTITDWVNLDAIVEPPVGGDDDGDVSNVPESPVMWMMALGICVLLPLRRKLLPA